MRRKPRLSVFATSAVLLSVLPAVAEARPVVGIVPHPVVNVEQAERDEIARELGVALSRHYDVSLAKSAPPPGLPDDCVGQPACVQNVGQKMGADQLLFVVMVRVGSRLQIDPTWVDVSTGRTDTRDPILVEAGGSPREAVLRDAAPGLIPRGSAQTVAEATPAKPAVKPSGRPAPDTWRDSPGRGAGSVPPSEEGREIGAGVWIATGISAVTLVTGLALVMGGRADYNLSLEARCDVNPARCANLLSGYNTRSLVSSVLFAVSAAAGATALVLYAGEEDEPSLAVMPAGTGLAVGGSF